MGNPIQFDFSLFLTLIFPILFYLILFLFVVCFMVGAIRFFKRKIAIDEEILQKLDELIKLHALKSDNQR